MDRVTQIIRWPWNIVESPCIEYIAKRIIKINYIFKENFIFSTQIWKQRYSECNFIISPNTRGFSHTNTSSYQHIQALSNVRSESIKNK